MKIIQNLRRLGFGLIFLQLGMRLAFGQWSEPVSVSEGSNPDLEVDQLTGDALILAMEKGVLITRLNQSGQLISQESVPTASTDVGGIGWGAGLAVGPSGEPHVIYRYRRSLDVTGYYTYKTASGWSSPYIVYTSVYRAWNPRIVVDQLGRVHIAYGFGNKSTDDPNGTITYNRLENSHITATKTGIQYYRADVNFEMCGTPDGEVHVITGNAAYPPEGGPIKYYHSLDGGVNWVDVGDIHSPDARAANAFVDIFVDADKNCHICYSTENDRALRGPGIRYARFKNGSRVRDVLVTLKDEITKGHLNLGLSSVAASPDGQYVMLAYISNQDGGNLYARLSSDGGQTWGDRQLLGTGINTVEGRSRHWLRAYGHRFYLAYPNGGIKFRYYQVPGFEGPIARSNGPYQGVEGTPISFSAAGSRDSEGIAFYAWDWNSDGIFDDSTTIESITHTYFDDYQGQVTLRVRSNRGKMTTAQSAATIQNAAPIVELGADQTLNEGTNFHFSAQVTDPGVADVLRYDWDFGDGAKSDIEAPNHVYVDNGTFTVTLVVTDDDGGVGRDQMTLTVQNVAPTVDAGGPYPGKPNENITLQGTAIDPGARDVLTFAWDLNQDQVFETPGKTVTVKFSSPGVYQVQLKVTDDDGGAATDEAEVHVQNQAPQVKRIPDQTIDEGGQFTPIHLDEYVSDPDDSVATLNWHAENNQQLVIQITDRVATVKTPSVDWFGQEQVRFMVADGAGNADSAVVLFTVKAVNDPPGVRTIPAQSTTEGTPFEKISLDQYIQDVDHELAQLKVSFTGNSQLSVTLTDWTAQVAVSDSEWAGTENITFIATDPDGLSGQTTTTFTLLAVNDPPRIEHFPDQELQQYQAFQPISLDAFVFDPDHRDDQLVWSYTGNINLKITINPLTRTLDVEPIDPNWYGVERVLLIVADPGQLQAQQSVNFTVLQVDARPNIRPISDQTIDEGSQFTPIHLDEYVSDINHSPAEISWTSYGAQALTVKWNQHTVTVETPTENWSGREVIYFVATDPTQLADTATVVFTVREMNDPPTIAGVPPINFDEDQTFELTLASLREKSQDVDHPREQLRFGIEGNQFIRWETDSVRACLQLSAAPNYAGTETVQLYVADPLGARGSQSLIIKVNPQPDPVGTLALILPENEQIFTWPPEKQFSWRRAIDPDPNDQVFYQWLLSPRNTFADTVDQAFVGVDTTYLYQAKQRMNKGVYFWKIVAYSTDGSSIESEARSIQTAVDEVEAEPGASLPPKFALLPNHPNPFNPATHINYELPAASWVQLAVFNALGQQVKLLVNSYQPAGRYSVAWTARDDFGSPAASGIYLCQLKVAQGVYYIKMLLMQ